MREYALEISAPQTSTSEKPFPWVALLVLATTAFFMVTSEFLPTGLLPVMAKDLGVSESQIGFLITLFAAMVVVSSLPLTALTQRFSRKSLVVVVLAVFIAANVLGAVAPNYAVLAVARVVGGLCHGLFWSVVGAYAGHLVTRKHLPRALAITGGGATAAFVLGIPMSTALGYAIGWRLTLVVIAVLQSIVILLVLKFVPPVDHRPPLTTGEVHLPLRRNRLLVVFITISIIQAVLVIGQYTFYSYIAPFLLGPSGFSESALVPLLFAYGAAGALGLALSPFVANRFPRYGLATMVVFIIVGLIAIGLYPAVPAVVIAGLVLWGVAFGIAPVIMQAGIMHAATARTRDVASAFMNTAYNIGIGGGALIGGLVLDYIGLAALPLVAAGIMVVSIAMIVVTDVRQRRRDARLVS
jgi:MFS transporter, DHA1 family, inner membrane transport protein